MIKLVYMFVLGVQATFGLLMLFGDLYAFMEAILVESVFNVGSFECAD